MAVRTSGLHDLRAYRFHRSVPSQDRTTWECGHERREERTDLGRRIGGRHRRRHGPPWHRGGDRRGRWPASGNGGGRQQGRGRRLPDSAAIRQRVRAVPVRQGQPDSGNGTALEMEAKQQHFTIWYFIAAMLILFLVQALVVAPHVENLSYSEFKSLVAKGKVGNLVVGKQVITGTLAANGLEGLLPKEKIDELKRYGGGVHRLGTPRGRAPRALAPLAPAAR